MIIRTEFFRRVLLCLPIVSYASQVKFADACAHVKDGECDEPSICWSGSDTSDCSQTDLDRWSELHIEASAEMMKYSYELREVVVGSPQHVGPSGRDMFRIEYSCRYDDIADPSPLAEAAVIRMNRGTAMDLFWAPGGRRFSGDSTIVSIDTVWDQSQGDDVLFFIDDAPNDDVFLTPAREFGENIFLNSVREHRSVRLRMLRGGRREGRRGEWDDWVVDVSLLGAQDQITKARRQCGYATP